MLVTQVTSSNMPAMSVGTITQEQLLQEFNFLRAKEIAQVMLSVLLGFFEKAKEIISSFALVDTPN